MGAPPRCSVVVCTRDRPELLARCLESLGELRHDSYEIVVVDNTRGHRDVQTLAAAAGVRCVTEPVAGHNRARNTGARHSLGDLVAYLDDDALPDRDWLSRHEARLGDTTLSATTGRVVPLAAEDPGARRYSAMGGEDLGTVPFRVDRSSPWWFERTNFGGVGVGPNMVFRRSLFETGWGFHEGIGLGTRVPGNDEHHAFFTLIRDGGAIAYVPDAVVRHSGPVSEADFRARRRRILRAGTAYGLLLLIQEPEYRGRLLRFAWRGVRGRGHSWRPNRDGGLPPALRDEVTQHE